MFISIGIMREFVIAVCVALATLVETQNKHLDSSGHIMGSVCQKPPVDKLLFCRSAVVLSFAE